MTPAEIAALHLIREAERGDDLRHVDLPLTRVVFEAMSERLAEALDELEWEA